MDLQILQDRLNNLANELKVIRKQLEEAEKEQKSRRWKPQDGDGYYFIGDSGNVSFCTWTDHRMDKERHSIGNTFKTGDEAKFERERLRVLVEMREFEESSDRKWDCINSHYYIFYDVYSNKIRISYLTTGKDYNIFFESEEKAHECISKVGADRIKRFYLRIKED